MFSDCFFLSLKRKSLISHWWMRGARINLQNKYPSSQQHIWGWGPNRMHRGPCAHCKGRFSFIYSWFPLDVGARIIFFSQPSWKSTYNLHNVLAEGSSHESEKEKRRIFVCLGASLAEGAAGRRISKCEKRPSVYFYWQRIFASNWLLIPARS